MDKVDDPSFATAVGLLMWEAESFQQEYWKNKITGKILGNISGNVSGMAGNMKKWIGKFLP